MVKTAPDAQKAKLQRHLAQLRYCVPAGSVEKLPKAIARSAPEAPAFP